VGSGIDGLAAGDPLAHRDAEIFDRRAVDWSGLPERALENAAVLAERLAGSAAEIEILRALLRADEAAYAGARLAGDDKALPGRRRGLRLRGDDVDLIAVARCAAAKAGRLFGADAGVADLE
jgi:hypothetical protein